MGATSEVGEVDGQGRSGAKVERVRALKRLGIGVTGESGWSVRESKTWYGTFDMESDDAGGAAEVGCVLARRNVSQSDVVSLSRWSVCRHRFDGTKLLLMCTSETGRGPGDIRRREGGSDSGTGRMSMLGGRHGL